MVDKLQISYSVIGDDWRSWNFCVDGAPLVDMLN